MNIWIVEAYDAQQKRWQPWPDAIARRTRSEVQLDLEWCRHDHGATGLKFREAQYVKKERRRAPLMASEADLRAPRHIIDLAVTMSTFSPCRSKRGVVVFRDYDVVSTGHNYKPRAFACDGSQSCKASCRVEAIHAEQQALFAGGARVAGAEMLHVKTVQGLLVPSGGPSCVQCSKLALVTGITGAWLYLDDGWHRYETEDFHRLSLAALRSSVPVERVTPAGETPKDDFRCAICGWPLDRAGKFCVPGNCSQRPLPSRFYDPSRAKAEYAPHLDDDQRCAVTSVPPSSAPAETRKPWCQICGKETAVYCAECQQATTLAAPAESSRATLEQLQRFNLSIVERQAAPFTPWVTDARMVDEPDGIYVRYDDLLAALREDSHD